jgi:hypothetical protein
MVKPFGAAVVLGLLSTVASAQTVDPRYVQFTASADHGALTGDGQPVVASYQMAWYPIGAAAPSQTLDLGKPIPDANGTIVVDLNTVLTSAPTAGVIYDARVAAVGPTGSAVSGDSNSFTYSGPCTYAVSPTSVAAAASGGVGPLGVTTAASCPWSTTSQAPWLTLDVSSDTGSASTTLTIASNPTAAPRTGTAAVAGATVNVTQDAAVCGYSVSPLTAAAGASGTSASATVTTTVSGCAWNAVSNVTWITPAATGGVDAQTLAYTIAANTATAARTGTLTIAGQTVTVSQAAAAPAPCAYALSATSASVGVTGGTGSVVLTTSTVCTWTATSSAGWLTVSPANGTGAGTLTYAAAKSNSAAKRTATLTIGGQVFTVTEASKK